MKLAFSTALAVFTIAIFANIAVAQTEGRVLDATCNCALPAQNNQGPIDENLLRRIQEQAGNPKDEAKKLFAKVKSYRCPRIKAKRDEFESDEMEELDSSEILDELILRAGVNENYLESEDRDRASEILDKKVSKCNDKMAQQRMKSSNPYASNNSSQNSSSSSMTLMRLMQMMQMMNSQYNTSSFYPHAYNPYLNGRNTGLTGYSPVNTTMATNSLGVNTVSLTGNGLGYLPYYQYQNQNSGYLNNYLWGYAR